MDPVRDHRVSGRRPVRQLLGADDVLSDPRGALVCGDPLRQRTYCCGGGACRDDRETLRCAESLDLPGSASGGRSRGSASGRCAMPSIIAVRIQTDTSWRMESPWAFVASASSTWQAVASQSLTR